MVPILRADSEPNIDVEVREHSWRDRMASRTARRCERYAATDLDRLRQIATYL